MKGIDHLVLAGHDLAAMRQLYAALGFTLTPPALHPFGTANSLVQLDGCFLELLTVADPAAIPEATPERFSFAAFNRDFLGREEGFSMLVLDSADARADVAAYRAAGLRTWEPFDFSRQAKLPDGLEVTVGFSLAFAGAPDAPRAGFFSCQQHAPQHFWKPEYQRHANTARTITEVVLVAQAPEKLEGFIAGFSGVPAEQGRCATARGAIRLLTPAAWFAAFRQSPPSLAQGPRLAGCTIAVEDLDAVTSRAAAAGLPLTGSRGRYTLAAEHAFGVAVSFVRA